VFALIASLAALMKIRTQEELSCPVPSASGWG